MTTQSVSALEHRHRASHRFDPVDDGGRERSPDHLHVRGRDRRDALFRRDALRSEESAESRQRPLRAVEGARGADSVRGLGARRPLSRARSCSSCASSTPTSRGTRRRGCRLSMWRRALSARASAPPLARRSTRGESSPTTAPMCSSATARWPKARCGKRLMSALFHKLDNLCGIIDVNGLGQSQHTQFEHSMDEIAARWNAFGWHTLIVDGHDVEALLHAFAAAKAAKHHPTMILARTLKGKGVASVEGKDGWHGQGVQERRGGRQSHRRVEDPAGGRAGRRVDSRDPCSRRRSRAPPRRLTIRQMPAPSYKPGEQVATREAWGTALAALGAIDPRVVALDADVKNSTFSDRFEKTVPRSVLRELHRRAGDGRRRDGPRRPRRDRVCVDVCVFPHARRRLHPDGRPVERAIAAQREADRIARRDLDRRGRSVADGARGSRDDARRAQLRGALPLRRRQHRAAGRRDGGVSRAGVHAHVAAEDRHHLRSRRAVPDWRIEGALSERGRRRDGRGGRRDRLRGA